MGFRSREIEVKLIVPGLRFEEISIRLGELLQSESPIVRIGTSVDTYWAVSGLVPGAAAQFLRVRERDGIRQITVKGVDRGSNVNRIEVDIDSTSEVYKIHRLVRTVLGKPLGVIGKTYRVWELESEYDTVCAYEVTTPHYPSVIVEVEARSEARMRELEAAVRDVLPTAYPAPGSLFEMFLQKQTLDVD